MLDQLSTNDCKFFSILAIVTALLPASQLYKQYLNTSLELGQEKLRTQEAIYDLEFCKYTAMTRTLYLMNYCDKFFIGYVSSGEIFTNFPNHLQPEVMDIYSQIQKLRVANGQPRYPAIDNLIK